MTRTKTSAVLLAVLVVGMTIPALAASPAPAVSSTDPASTQVAQVNQTQNQSSVNVTVGQQLSTVISVSSDEVQTEFENTAFELSVERGDEERRPAAIADRTAELRDRAEEIHDSFEKATEAYRHGEISKSAYANRLANLNARASNVLSSVESLRDRAAAVSKLDLRAAGGNLSALNNSLDRLESVDGAGARAILNQYTGTSQGEIEIEADDGVSISVQSEDGEHSREYERSGDADRSLSVNQSSALETARGALSSPGNGSWMLVGSKLDHDDGVYEFQFHVGGNASVSGSAEVAIDASSGQVVSLEEETESHEMDDQQERGDDQQERSDDQQEREDDQQERSDDQQEREDDQQEREDDQQEREDDQQEREDDPGELALVIANGDPAPNATVGVRAFADGAPAGNVTVYLNGQAVGTTDDSGRVTVTLPASGDAKLTARAGDAEGELEFEFGSESDGVFRKLNVDASLDNDTMAVNVNYDGSAVPNATISANDRTVGTTDADGSVSVPINGTNELDLEIVKGEFEAEMEYEAHNGTLSMTKDVHDGDQYEDGADDSQDDSNDDQYEDGADDSQDDSNDDQYEDNADDKEQNGDETEQADVTDDDETQQVDDGADDQESDDDVETEDGSDE